MRANVCQAKRKMAEFLTKFSDFRGW
jgi:hypothetical protein